MLCKGKLVVEDIPWSRVKIHITTPLISHIGILAELLPWKRAAELFSVHWNTVKYVVKQIVEYGLEHREIGNVIYFGIDEISRKKGQVYLTNVYDLKEKRLIWSGEDRDKNMVKKFYNQVEHKLNVSVTAICCDIWQPYIDNLKLHFSDAIIVFDKFHIVSHLNKAVGLDGHPLKA